MLGTDDLSPDQQASRSELLSPGDHLAEAEEAQAQQEARRQMHELIAGLPLREKEVAEMVYLQGLTTRDVGARLGMAEGTVKATTFRVREKLKRALAP